VADGVASVGHPCSSATQCLCRTTTGCSVILGKSLALTGSEGMEPTALQVEQGDVGRQSRLQGARSTPARSASCRVASVLSAAEAAGQVVHEILYRQRERLVTKPEGVAWHHGGASQQGYAHAPQNAESLPLQSARTACRPR